MQWRVGCLLSVCEITWHKILQILSLNISSSGCAVIKKWWCCVVVVDDDDKKLCLSGCCFLWREIFVSELVDTSRGDMRRILICNLCPNSM
jgi:hypothetical protein